MSALALAMAVSAVFATIVIVMLRRSAWAKRLVDRPNERSLHEQPTPRIGGIGVMASVLAVGLVVGPASLQPAMLCAAMLVVVSTLDDVHSLPIEVRLPAHVAAALVVVLAIGAPEAQLPGLTLLEAAILVVAIVWMTNLYNFMDGTDGLAGAMTVIGFGALAIAGLQANDVELAAACAACAAAAAAFLAFNWPPARVFLGDGGAVPLGFLAASFGAYGALRAEWPWWFPVLVFSPFIADASLTLARRVLRGEPFWRAHRTHAYQRLVLAGWGKRRLLACATALMLAASAAALLALRTGTDTRFGILLGSFIAYVLIFAAVERIARASVTK